MRKLSPLRLFKKMSDNRMLVSAQISLTDFCNENCIHCMEQKHSKSRMSKNMVQNILMQLKTLGCMSVTFTGGEALLEPITFFAIEEAAKHNMKIRLLTNGTLITDDNILFFKKFPLLSIQISLYAADPKIHDSITRRKNSYKETTNAITLLKAHGIRFDAAMIVMQKNFDQVLPTMEYAKKEKFDLTLDYLIRPSENSCAPLRNRITDSQLKEAFDMRILPHINKKGEFARKSKRKFCVEDFLKTHLYISASGEVFNNVALRIKVGDIKKDSIPEIWFNSKKLREIQEIEISEFECFNCMYKDNCDWDIGLAYAEHGSIFKKPKELCRFIEFIGDRSGK